MTLIDDKRALRGTMLAWRATLAEEARRQASEGLLATFRRERPVAAPAIVSGFWPIKEEIDIRPLMVELFDRGCRLALPVVQGRGQRLLFRAWQPGDPLEAGVFGTWQPAASGEAVDPDMLLVPLLACDAEGWRLGYGGGFYDRTLALLGVPAIGIAYAGQEVASLPRGPHDMALTMVVTENGIRRFR